MVPAEQPARVVVVAGPSGSGKTVLCRRLSEERGWPVVNLDDFYKDGDDPTLPLVDLPGGDPAAMAASLRVLAALDPATRVVPGHGPTSTLGAELTTNPYLRAAR